MRNYFRRYVNMSEDNSARRSRKEDITVHGTRNAISTRSLKYIYRHVKYASYTYRTSDAVQAQRRDFRVVAVLKADAERGQKWRPRDFEHRPDVLQVFGSGERGLHVADRLH